MMVQKHRCGLWTRFSRTSRKLINPPSANRSRQGVHPFPDPLRLYEIWPCGGIDAPTPHTVPSRSANSWWPLMERAVPLSWARCLVLESSRR